MLYRGSIIYLLLLCLLFPVNKAFCENGQALSSDSVERFFDRIELLRWSSKNEDVIDLVQQFLTSSSYNNFLKLRATNELAENWRWKREYNKALRILRGAEQTYDIAEFSDKSEWIRLVLYKAKVYRVLGLPDSAEINYKLALNLVDEFGYQQHRVHGEIWMDWAYYIRRKGIHETAIEYNLKALDIFQQSLPPMDIKYPSVFYDLASNYRTIGDFERGANCARIAEMMYTHHGSSFAHLTLNSQVVLGNCYFDNGEYEKTNQICEDVIAKYESGVTERTSDMIRIFFNNGEALLHLGEYQRAKMFIERSVKINPGESGNNMIDLAYSYLALSDFELQVGNYAKVEELLSEALKIHIRVQGDDNEDVADVYSFMGRNFEGQGRFDLALRNYQKAMIAAINDFDDEDIFVNPPVFDSIPKKTAIPLIFDKARAYIGKYHQEGDSKDQKRAFELYEIAYQLIREAANESIMEESLLEIQQYHQRDLNLGLECALSLYRQSEDNSYLNQLLQFIETNKYFLLQNSVRKSRTKDVLGIPEDAYQKERELLERINSLKQFLNNTSFLNAEEELSKRLELFEVTRQWEMLRLQWNSSTESTFSLNELENEISIDSLRKGLIGHKDILLEYFQTSDTLYTLAVTQDQVQIFSLQKTRKFDECIGIYVDHLYQNDETDSLPDYLKFVHSANYLYQKLLQPIIDSPIVSQSIDRITIVPDGQLSLLPFESLIRQLPTDTTGMYYAALDYVCRKYSINYGYSLSILSHNMLTRSSAIPNRMLAFSFSSNDQSSDTVSRNDNYGELPFSATELRNLKTKVKGIFLDGDDATEYNFKSLVQDHSIIHLALHGEADTVDMLNSKIIFKAPGAPTEDGFLFAHELYGIDMSRSQMAVLSACETGIGKRMEGEGVYSLARGFAYAGCPSIVMSLWKVNDKTTAQIMDYFYQYLGEGLPKDEALCEAKLSYLRNADDLSAHPTNWAAFITLGNSDPVELPVFLFQWYHWVLLVSTLLMALFLAMRLRNRNQSA